MWYILIAILVVANIAGAGDDGPGIADLPGMGDADGRLGELQTKLSLAKAQIVAGKPEDAIKTLKDVYRADVTGKYRVETLYYEGFAYNALGDFEASEGAYIEALAFSPGHTDICLGLGQTYLDLQKYDDAEVVFATVIEKKPDETYASTGLGYIELSRGSYDKAEEHLEKAIASDNSNGLAHSYLGLLYKSQGDLERARAELETAVYYSPGNLTANYNLATVCLEQGYYDGAVEYFGKVLEEKPDDVEARYWLALCLEALGRNAEALENIQYLKDAGHKDSAFDTVEDRLKKKLGK